MAQSDIEIRPRRKHKHDAAMVDDPKQKSSNPLDAPEVQKRFTQVQEWRRQAQQAQGVNRHQMAIDEDYHDGEQWSEEDKAVLEERGQAATVFNLIFNTVRWVTGTEKRTRVDYRVLGRNAEAGKDAETKTKLIKYLSDVNRSGFARSKAFEQTAKAGLGWLECGIRNDEDDEPLFVRWESWRNVWYDPHSVEADLSDARFVFREKWVDLDVAQAMFPKRAAELEAESRSVTDPAQVRTDSTLNRYLYGDEELITSYSNIGDMADMGSRPRVKLTECWYRVPLRCKVLKGSDEAMKRHSFNGAIFNQDDPVHAWAVKNELASTYDAVKMQMRLMMYCGGTLLQDACSPYWHNRFPLTPIWGYRRGRDNAPYGIVRQLRDPQDDLNKRRSKALLLLSTNQIIADEDAFANWDEAIEEVARPNGVLKKKKNAEVQIRNNAALAPMHVNLMDQDARYIQEVGGVTDENMGRQTNATSGVAIEARQNQGYTSNSDLFDNLRMAIQLHGELELALIEQYYDQEKVFRLTGERGNADYHRINTSPEDQITANQADFIVDEQDFRGTIRQAMFDQMLEMITKLPPQIGLKLLVIAFEMSDVPMKEDFVRILREATGMPDPEEELTLEQQAAREQQQKEAEATQQRQMEAQLSLIEGKAKEALAKGNKAVVEQMLTKLKALQQSMEIAGAAGVAPRSLAQAADQIMRDVSGVNNVAPGLPAGVQ